jgi:ribonuclease P protein component
LPTEGESRLGITVTTKVDKSSVQRNRLKRRLKEVWRKERHGFQKQAEFVVIALTGATTLDYWGVERELLLLLREAGFLPRLEAEKKQGENNQGGTNQDGDERGE